MPAANFARWLSTTRHFPDPPGIVTAVEVGVSITFIKYHPKIKPSAYAPLAPSVTCGDSSLPEGAMGCIPFHIGLCLWKVPAVQSLSHASGVPAPFDKGAFGCTADTGRGGVPPLSMPTVAFCNSLLP